MPPRPHALPTGFIAPCLPTNAPTPSGREWVHEIKFDGFRVIARKDGQRVRLYSRPGMINAALADPKMKARFAELGGTALPGTPADFAKLIADETEKWGKVIKAVNIKLE